MDSGMSRPYGSYTTAQLKVFIAEGRGTEVMIKEVARREAVAAGDESAMFPWERLRAKSSK